MNNDKRVTLTVNECSEFHNLGESHENINTVAEAIHIWERIPAERMHGIKSIGIRVADKSNPNNYSEMDVVVGKHMDLDMLHYYPDITENEKAMDMVRELQRKMPELEVMGVMLEREKEIQEQSNRTRRYR